MFQFNISNTLVCSGAFITKQNDVADLEFVLLEEFLEVSLCYFLGELINQNGALILVVRLILHR